MTAITVLTGGSTPERNVALSGARRVVEALRRRGHTVAVVDTCGGLLSPSSEKEVLGQEAGSRSLSAAECCRLRERENLIVTVDLPAVLEADVVFPLLHGEQGEGGFVQGLLEFRGVRFVGSDGRGSALAMDKETSKRLFGFAGVPTPAWVRWPARMDEVERLGLPAVVKPSRVGSSVGASVIDSLDELDEAIGVALQFDHEVLIERFLPGRELTVGVLGERALAVGEIRTLGRLFDFHSKYVPGGAEEIFPAPITKPLEYELQRLAVLAHQTLRLRDVSRVDFRLDEHGSPFCLEVNTLPGMTETSLLPQSAAAEGISYDELCDRLVDMAMARTRQG